MSDTITNRLEKLARSRRQIDELAYDMQDAQLIRSKEIMRELGIEYHMLAEELQMSRARVADVFARKELLSLTQLAKLQFELEYTKKELGE